MAKIGWKLVTLVTSKNISNCRVWLQTMNEDLAGPWVRFNPIEIGFLRGYALEGFRGQLVYHHNQSEDRDY